MKNRRWWGLGLLGIALAGTIALVIPSEAQTGAMMARNDFGATRQPDRAVQQEAQAIANRIDEAMRRSASLLQTLADGDLSVFERERVALNAAPSQWPVALFTASPAKGSEFSVQPPGERFIGPEDVVAIQNKGVWIAERSAFRSIVVAVPSRTGQVLASRVPFQYFTQGLNAIPRSNGVRRYLLDASGKPLEGEVAPSGEDRDWCQQLLALGEGFLATSDALFSVARVPSTGWAVVVRHPIGGTNPVLTFDAGTLAGPAMVASGPLQAPGLPKGILLYPLAGAALLFGLAIVGWKQRWPGLEDGPIAFGENAFKTVTAPLRDRFDRRTPAPESLPSSTETSLAAFAAEVPTKLPAAIAGDVDFLRTEQVRNLREIWSHTEERLSGQRNWVRDEVRRVQESTTTSVAELGSIVNLAEQRLEDARSAWSEVQVSLLARIDEARSGVASQQEAQDELRHTLEDQLADLRNALASEQEAREEQGKRLAKGLGDLASGLESENADRSRQDDLLAKDLGGLTTGVADLKSELDALSALMHEEFARLDSVLQGARTLMAELDAREAESRSRWEAAMATQTERNEQLVGDLAQARTALASELAAAKTELGGEMEAIAERTRQLGESLETLETRLSAPQTGVEGRLGELQTLVQEALPPLRQELEALRDLSTSVEQISYRLDAHAERFEGLSALEEQLLEMGKRMDQRFSELDAAGRSVDDRLSEQAEDLETANERLFGLSETLDAVSERLAGTQEDLEALQGTLDTRLSEQQAAFDQLLDEQRDRSQRLAAEAESLAKRAEKIEDLTVSRLEATDKRLSELSDRTSAHDRAIGDIKPLQSELSGLKGRLEGMAMAHARQQEALNAALQQISGVQQAIQSRADDTALQDQVDELTHFVHQLAEQSQLLAQALEASTAAASRSEGWVGEQLGLIRHEQSEAISALAQENAALRASLDALRDGNEALSNRMHMVVQVLSKLSK